MPKGSTRETFRAIWERFGVHRIHHLAIRPRHLAFLVGDASHTADVWRCWEDLNASLRRSGPIADELAAQLSRPPQVGKLLDVVVPVQ